MNGTEVRVGTAGWKIAGPVRGRFAGEGTHLERYARRFSGVEINSSFYRPHRPSTYARWAASVPDGFRFALKVPKEITHKRRLVDATEPLEAFLAESAPLGEKRGVLLVQLPPSFAYDADVVSAFLSGVRARYDGLLACEPRHATWFTAEANDALRRFEVARVAADPALVPEAAVPAGWDGFAYYRLHGAPRTYYSSYDDQTLRDIAQRLRAAPGPAWCIFDNTAMDAAASNALDLTELFV
ncbi:MAG: hypothetical protein QOJ39_2107 [Candidatus Eremiobacteraeota bacterium]|jgi:uncharacterized protein YecE (DUF72 family)|nr:hypothetical protein [Candidatus Eremiobacteraeota bacterium]